MATTSTSSAFQARALPHLVWIWTVPASGVTDLAGAGDMGGSVGPRFMPTTTPAKNASRLTEGSFAKVLLFAFGYLACYVPYSALTKAMTGGHLGLDVQPSGMAILPVTALASMVSMFVTIGLLGGFSQVSRQKVLGRSIPFPSLGPLVSGTMTALIIPTTTLAYTFEGVSVPLAMVWMRASVLAVAPLVDVLTGHRIRWMSGLAVLFSVIAATTSIIGQPLHNMSMPMGALIDLSVYVLAYVVRLTLMSKFAKRAGADGARRFFYEEQMVATPLLVLMLLVGSLTPGEVGDALREGWTYLAMPALLGLLVLTGVLSQGSGFFGGLVLIDARESSFTVPINRAASLIAGALSGILLFAIGLDRAPHQGELIATAILVFVISMLGYGESRTKKQASKPSG